MNIQDLDTLQVGDMLRYRWDDPDRSQWRLYRVANVHPSSHELGAYLALVELRSFNTMNYLTTGGALSLAEKWHNNTLALFLPDLALAPKTVKA